MLYFGRSVAYIVAKGFDAVSSICSLPVTYDGKANGGRKNSYFLPPELGTRGTPGGLMRKAAEEEGLASYRRMEYNRENEEERENHDNWGDNPKNDCVFQGEPA